MIGADGRQLARAIGLSNLPEKFRNTPSTADPTELFREDPAMRISLRLRQLLGPDAERRGIIADMEREAKVERHTIAALLHNRVNSLNLDILSRICTYLVNKGYVPEESLPGALFGRDIEDFWKMLTGCERIDLCVGARPHEKKLPGRAYVSHTDSRLQGELVSQITLRRYRARGRGQAPADSSPQDTLGKKRGRAGPPDAADGPEAAARLIFAFHHVGAPERDAKPDHPGKRWDKDCAETAELYTRIRRYTEDRALIAIGSIKVNHLVEKMFSEVFSPGAEFTPQDDLAEAQERIFPIFLRYRDDDTQPPSFCGGTRLAGDTPSDEPGVYYEAEGGRWRCCPFEDRAKDAAVLYVAQKRALGLLEFACGGFSTWGTRLLTDHLEPVVSQLEYPVYENDELRLGLYVVRFERRKRQRSKGASGADDEYRDWTCQVVSIPEEAIRRRLAGK
jgi:hypothetical protein